MDVKDYKFGEKIEPQIDARLSDQQRFQEQIAQPEGPFEQAEALAQIVWEYGEEGSDFLAHSWDVVKKMAFALRDPVKGGGYRSSLEVSVIGSYRYGKKFPLRPKIRLNLVVQERGATYSYGIGYMNTSLLDNHTAPYTYQHGRTESEREIAFAALAEAAELQGLIEAAPAEVSGV